MNRRSLLLTVDYEIFGNGSGDPREHIVDPTARMARICDKFGAPLTIFFEVEEYLAFERNRQALVQDLGYDPAAEIRTQLVDLARRGHDLQLHLHPEWVGAEYVDRSWRLRPEKSSVDSLFDSETETFEYLRSRKAVVDGLREEAGCAESTTTYRAGAFCAQPGRKLLAGLARNGFVVESSVVKDMWRRDQYATLDFSSAPQLKRHWLVKEDVAREDPAGGIFEVPIFSRMGRRYQQLTPRRLAAKFSRKVPAAKQREMIGQLKIGRSPVSIGRFLLQRFPIKLDFHNMSSGQMLRWVRSAPPASPGEVDAIVLIGHTKEHRDDRDFERFLSGVANDPALEVISMSELSKRLRLLQRAA